MMVVVEYKGQSWFAIGANMEDRTLLLHNGAKVHSSEVSIDRAQTDMWASIVDLLPTMVAYCFERGCKIVGGRVLVESEHGLVIEQLGENPLVALLIAVRTGISIEGYTAVYAGPEMVDALSNFWRAMFRAYMVKNDLVMVGSVNVLLDLISVLMAKPVPVPGGFNPSFN